MTETIVVASTNTAVARTTETTYVVTGIVGPPGPSRTLLSSSDVNSTQLSNGSVLVYNSQTSRFDTTTALDKQIINGGIF